MGLDEITNTNIKEEETKSSHDLGSERSFNEYIKNSHYETLRNAYNGKEAMLGLDRNGKIIFINKAAMRKTEFYTRREWNTRESDPTRKKFNKRISAQRILERKKPFNVRYLRIRTAERNDLFLCNLRVEVNRDFSIVYFKNAYKKEIKPEKVEQKKIEPYVKFIAPSFLDLDRANKLLFLKTGNWSEKLITYCVNKPENQKLEVDMHKVQKISDGTLKIVVTMMQGEDYLISNPSKDVYDRLIAEKFPKNKIIGYEEPIKQTESASEPKTGLEGKVSLT